MALTFSDPSNSRFHTWRNPTDFYNHSQLAANWDAVDAILGFPSTGSWPPDSGLDMGIFKEVNLLKQERVPLGTVIAWWRPTNTVAVPSGWAVCDGSTTSTHDYAGGGSIILPDLRNRFVLGAESPAKGFYPGDGIAASSGDHPTSSADTATNAPGIRGKGGSNIDLIVPDHYHIHSHLHKVGGIHATETTSASGDSEVGSAIGGSGISYSRQVHTHELISLYDSLPRAPANPNKRVPDISGTDNSGNNRLQTSLQVKAVKVTPGSYYTSLYGTASNNISGSQYVVGSYANSPDRGTATIDTDGLGNPGNSATASGDGDLTMPRLPLYVGLLYLVKVKRAATVVAGL